MSLLRVDTTRRLLSAGTVRCPCVIGRAGAVAAVDKREGDGATPLGRWPVRAVLLRPDRMADMAPLALALPWRWLRPSDGWSDDGADSAYNRPVSLPHRFRHERLWRDDHAYDAIVILGHNDRPPVPGMGSAIFFHIFNRDRDGEPLPTEGCVAVSEADMRAVLPLLNPGSILDIAAS